MNGLDGFGELTVHEFPPHGVEHGGLINRNIPLSFEVTSLLEKLDSVEQKIAHQLQQQNPIVKIIEVDPYLHRQPSATQLQPESIAGSEKTRLFLAVAWKQHCAVAQLFALELQHIDHGSDEESDEEDSLSNDDSDVFEWVDVSNVRVLSQSGSQIEELNELGETGSDTSAVIYPLSHADCLPLHLQHNKDDDKNNSVPDPSFNASASKSVITSCSLIPSPSLRINNDSSSTFDAKLSNFEHQNGRLLTQRAVAIVLGTSLGRVLSLPLYISEKVSGPMSAVGTAEGLETNVKFVLDYGNASQWGNVTMNTVAQPPCVYQILPNTQLDPDRNFGDNQSSPGEGDTAKIVGVFDGNVDSDVQVFHPSVQLSESKSTSDASVSSIMFCRGTWNEQCVANDKAGKEIKINRDIVWITCENGAMLRLPSWKFFIFSNNTLATTIGDNDDYLKKSGNGVSVIPLHGDFPSVLDVPPQKFSRPSHARKSDLSVEEDGQPAQLKHYEDGCATLDSSNETLSDYWHLLHLAVESQKYEGNDSCLQQNNNSITALILPEQAGPVPPPPLSFQTSRPEYAPKAVSTLSGDGKEELSKHPEQISKDVPDDDGSSSSSEDYGPLTGTVIEGTAALVKGALGVAFGAVRWGLGRGSNMERSNQPTGEDEDDTPLDEFMDVDETDSARLGNDETISPQHGKENLENGNQRTLIEQGEVKDLFPLPLNGVALLYSDVPRRFLSATVDPSGSFIVTTDSLGRVILFDLETNQPVRMWKGMRNVSCFFSELPRNNQGGVSKRPLIYLVIHLRQRGTVEVYRLRQGPRIAVVAVPQLEGGTIIDCLGPPTEGNLVQSFLLERTSEPEESKCRYAIDCLFFEDPDCFDSTSSTKAASLSESTNRIQLLLQLLSPGTNIKCSSSTVLSTFKNISTLRDLSEGLNVLSKCNLLEENMGVNGSSFQSKAVAHCKSRLELAKEVESQEGSGMIRKAAIAELSWNISRHERIIRAYEILRRFELSNVGKENNVGSEDDEISKPLSAWASEAISWISVANSTNGNEKVCTVSTTQDILPIPFSTFAAACYTSNNSGKSQSYDENSFKILITAVKKDRIFVLAHIFQPLLQDLFVFKVVNNIFQALDIHHEFDTLQQYFGEWISIVDIYQISKYLSRTWCPLVRWLQDLILSAYELNQQNSGELNDESFLNVASLGSLLKFCMSMEDLPKAFLLSVVCLNAVSDASRQIEEKTFGKVLQEDCVAPWKGLLRKIRVCLLVSLRLAGDVCPTGGSDPFTIDSVSKPDIFSSYAWIARDQLTLSHDNNVIMALEKACLSSSLAFYPTSINGDTVSHRKSIIQSCSCPRNRSFLLNPTGVIDDDHSRPLLFYLKDHAKCTAQLAAHRALILGSLWGQSLDNLELLKNALLALRIVLEKSKEEQSKDINSVEAFLGCGSSATLAVLVEFFQTRIRPVCRAMIFGFDDVHELSKDIVLPLINDPIWKKQFSTFAKLILAMIRDCLTWRKPGLDTFSKTPTTYDGCEGDLMWPPLRVDPLVNSLVTRLKDVQISSVEVHHSVMFALELVTDIESLRSIVPSFSTLFLIGSLYSTTPPMPKGSNQQRRLLDKAIAEYAKTVDSPVVDHFDLKNLELVGNSWGFDFKYVRTSYFIEMIRLGKDASVDDLLGSSGSSLDKLQFVDSASLIICARLDATIASLKRTKSFRGVVSLLDADTSLWVKEIASQCTIYHAPVSLITANALVLRVQSMCENIVLDEAKRAQIDALVVMSGTLLKAVQNQEQLAVNV